jgi:hypothetical protein
VASAAVIAGCLMGGYLVGKSRIVKRASFKGVIKERAAIKELSFWVKNRNHLHKAAATGSVSYSLRKVGVH